MIATRRTRALRRLSQRIRRMPALNLVALMDIFTILVFFLLVNSIEVQDVPLARDVDLPESTVATSPNESVIVTVLADEIRVDGHHVLALNQDTAPESVTIEALRHVLMAEGGDNANTEITIMGERGIPYRLLRRVMATCAEAGFGELSLAVLQSDRGE